MGDPDLTDDAQAAVIEQLRADLATARAERREIVDVLARSNARYEASLDELRIANERGDGWREQVKEDTHRIEALEAALAEHGEIVDDVVSYYHMVEHHDGHWTECDRIVCAGANRARAMAVVLAGRKQ